MAKPNSNLRTQISLRLALFTDYGPVGPRLRRGEPLPEGPVDFPHTAKGIADAEKAQKAWQQYCDAHAK